MFEIFRFRLHHKPSKGGRSASRDPETGSGKLAMFRNRVLESSSRSWIFPPSVNVKDGAGGGQQLERSLMGPFTFENVTGYPDGLLDSPFSLNPSAACWDGCLTIRCRRDFVLYSVKRTSFPADIKARRTPCRTKHQKRSFAPILRIQTAFLCPQDT